MVKQKKKVKKGNPDLAEHPALQEQFMPEKKVCKGKKRG